MVRPRLEPGRGDRPVDDPERPAGEEGGGRLDGEGPVRREAPFQERVEALRVELPDGEAVRVGEVDEDEIEEARLRLEPLHRVVVDDRDLRREEGAAVQLDEERVLPREARHEGVEVDEDDLLDRGVPEHLADGEAVPAAEDRDAPGARDDRERGVDERLVVAVLVDGGELEVPVQEELEPGAVAGQDDALVRGALREEDLVGVLLLLGHSGEPVGGDEASEEERRDEARLREEAAGRSDLVAEEPDRGERDGDVQKAEEERRPEEAERRDEDEREEERGGERPEVVERQDLGDEVLERHRPPQQPEHQGDLDADERPDGEDEAVEDRVEPARREEREREDERREAAEERDGDLDLHEPPCDALLDELRQPRSRPHRRQVDADDERELGDRVAEEVARERSGDELVDEPARGDDEDGQVDRPRPDRARRHRVTSRWRTR